MAPGQEPNHKHQKTNKFQESTPNHQDKAPPEIPGKGAFSLGGKRFKIVDLPGTYSLLSATDDEEVARNFILFGRPDVTVVVADAMRLERNLNLALQVLQITDKAILCVNLIDEAKAHGVTVDERGLARDLGVPVVLAAARQGEGIDVNPPPTPGRTLQGSDKRFKAP